MYVPPIDALADISQGGMPDGTCVFNAAGRRLIVATPNPRQYGHLATEVLYALISARATNLPLVFVRPSETVNNALFAVEAEGVRTIRSRTVRLLWKTQAAATFLRALWLSVRSDVRLETYRALGAYISRRGEHVRRPTLKRLKDHHRSLKRHGSGTKQAVSAPAQYVGYWRRRLLAEPLPTRLSSFAEARARSLAPAAGVDMDAPIVVVHARERGYKLGREVQDGKGSTRDDATRNSSIEAYFPAIDFLVGLGYTIVRVGDPTMTPLARPGVVDLATGPIRDVYLELACFFRARFLISGESGPVSVAYLANTAPLTVNCTDPVSAFPIRPNGVYMLKTIVDRASALPLTADALLSADYLANLRNSTRFEYVENTPEEILDGVMEMLDLLEHRTEPTPAQRLYSEHLTNAAVAMTSDAYIRKWGTDRGFMGGGRLSRAMAERWFGTGSPSRLPALNSAGATLDRGACS